MPLISNILDSGIKLNDRYLLESHIASGGFGNTYMANDILNGNVVAIKEFFMADISARDEKGYVYVPLENNKELFFSQMDKFQREACRLQELSNKNIVHVSDLFMEFGTVYYVMDYIDGESLADIMNNEGKPFSEKDVMRMLPQILNALKEVHKNKLLHLDIKPENIMLDRDGRIRLIDFGSSKVNMNTKGTSVDTAVTYSEGYAPMEQVEGNIKSIGPWTDFYALGATILVLLTNNLPPMPSDILDDPSPDKNHTIQIPTTVSKTMKELIVWLMQPPRNARPKSVEEIQHMLGKTPPPPPKKLPQPPEPLIIEGPGKKQSSHSMIFMLLLAALLVAVSVFVAISDEIINAYKNAIIAACGGAAIFIFILAVTGNKKNGMSKRRQYSILQNLMKNMVLVEGGTFNMGASPEQEYEALSDEWPAHNVTVSSFSIGRYEVTQDEWEAVMGTNPSKNKGGRKPVENVNWSDCQRFIAKLNAMTGKKFRLPTEAEWEYAARGGNKAEGHKYPGGDDITELAWMAANSENETHQVGTKNPNELGLYDMAGNVWEWCANWYLPYTSLMNASRRKQKTAPIRVLRGGGFKSAPTFCRVSFRGGDKPNVKDIRFGFRLAMQ